MLAFGRQRSRDGTRRVLFKWLAAYGVAAHGCGSQPSPAPEASPGVDAGPTDAADCEVPRFSLPTPVEVTGWNGDIMEPFIAPDGETLLFNNSNRPEVDTNLHWARRTAPAEFTYQGLVEGVATPALEGVPTLDREGNLYFVSTRSYDATASTIFRGRFESGTVRDVGIVPGVSREQPPFVNFDVEVSRDGLSLVFVDGRFEPERGEWSEANLVLAVKEQGEFRRVEEDGFDRIDSEDLEYAPALSADGATLYFTRAPVNRSSPPQIWVAIRRTPGGAFCSPIRIPGLGEFVEAATVLPGDDGILFHRRTDEGFRLFVSRVD